ncbi:MAG: GDP-mannose 4,6-dehydratase [Ginsengibacter sp.]
MQRILVTGGAGFIGSNLSKKLLNDNYEIICLDNFDSFYSRNQKELNLKNLKDKKNFKLIEGDIRNEEDLKEIEGIDIIIHLAAKTGVRPSIHQPDLYYDVNVKGTQNLLEFARQQNIKQFIFASSSSVYGINKNVPWKEDEILLPISPYASTKLACEMLGHVYHHLYEIRFLALRFFTAYGPSQRPDLAIHKFFKSILNNNPIPVFGDGSTSRDYTFVDDIVNGIVSAISYTASNYEIINLGNHQSVTLKELINAIEEISGRKAIINRLPEQQGDVSETYADISKAKSLLNYHPQTPLKDGLTSFYNWYVENANNI